MLRAHSVSLRKRCVSAELIEVHSYRVSPKDTGRSCGELERPSDEAVICNFHLPAKERGM